jgi:hypothetical protein
MSVYELRGILSQKRLTKGELAIKADALMKGIKHLLAASAVTPLEEIDAAGVLSLARELMEVKEKHSSVLEEIRKLKKELGEG